MKLDLFQFSSIHKLDPFAKFSFLKTARVGRVKMFIKHFDILNTVNSVNGWE